MCHLISAVRYYPLQAAVSLRFIAVARLRRGGPLLCTIAIWKSRREGGGLDFYKSYLHLFSHACVRDTNIIYLILLAQDFKRDKKKKVRDSALFTMFFQYTFNLAYFERIIPSEKSLASGVIYFIIGKTLDSPGLDTCIILPG